MFFFGLTAMLFNMAHSVQEQSPKSLLCITHKGHTTTISEREERIVMAAVPHKCTLRYENSCELTTVFYRSLDTAHQSEKG